MGLKWENADEIAEVLAENHPGLNPLDVRFIDLRQWVIDLDEFDDNPTASNESLLEAIQMAEQVHPDVVVMDISMPSLGGLEATRRIKRQMDDAQVLMLTMHDNEQFFFQAIQAGASGYVTKTAPEWELLTAIRSVDQGNCYLNAGVTKLLVSDYLERIKRGERRQPDDLLTDREREILNLVAAGHSNREIAQILNISEHTVHNHRAHLMEKLGIHEPESRRSRKSGKGAIRCGFRLARTARIRLAC